MTGELIGWLIVAIVAIYLASVIWRMRRRRTKIARFVDTPEAWAARTAVPGETREQARKRLEQYRVGNDVSED